ncbi:complement C2 [Salmo trutta]|uniref:C3/C5 convertase n=1 Tax=Salmo trutta TaxID=8032 RepID=A0A673ZXK2_SALTR|nr:complement C2-like [Salmo trutta]
MQTYLLSQTPTETERNKHILVMYAVTLLLCAAFSFNSVKEVWMQGEDYGDYEDEQPQNCSIAEKIGGGNVSYSQAGTEGSVLTYHCKAGHYPYPVSQRECSADGEWSTMRLTNGRRVSRASCKAIMCPGQLQLDHGEFWPREQWLKPGESQSFSCHSGFSLSGSAQRNCTSLGDWTGTIPVCDSQADDCKNPGVPPGALRSEGRFRKGEKVQYRCQMGLDLLGSAERVCLESREWSGSETRCQTQYAFDSPSAVADAMGGSLSGVMDVLSPEFIKKNKGRTFGRTLRVSDGRMNVFILMDTSGSISKTHFNLARDAIAALIRKLDSYEVELKFQVISYASQAKDIVDIVSRNDEHVRSNVKSVLKRLAAFDHQSHGNQTGTNLYAALYRVYERMAILRERNETRFSETQNVILIETDGYSNTGGSPLAVLAKIRSLLGYSTSALDHTDDKLLDVYVFGVGDNVNKNELNLIASRKRHEKHLFILKDYKQLGEVFNSMISDKSVIMCGVAQEDVSENQEEFGPTKTAYTRPWHVNVITTSAKSETCQGSIVTQNWILTAAHCFSTIRSGGKVNQDKVTVKIGFEGKEVAKVLLVIPHPQYNIDGLRHKNVKEFYDYDIALVKVEEIKPSWTARPICLPCTKPANRAMKMGPNSTCEQHEKALLPMEETRAYFINKGATVKVAKRKQTHIHTGSKRLDCIKQAENTLLTPHDATLNEYVPDRFLCSGGSADHIDAVTCKGDSGGALFLLNRLRYFQVGVVSWGTKNVCEPQDRSDRPPPDARDFHISVFHLLPWLKQHLGTDLEFLPMDD